MPKPELITAHGQFFTATCLQWKPLLKRDEYKDIITESLRFLVKNNRAIAYGFALLQNHLHHIWQMLSYLHQNPVWAGLCHFPEEYRYSSATYYCTGMDEWGFLSHEHG